jgi:hypothetical protein
MQAKESKKRLFGFFQAPSTGSFAVPDVADFP